MILQYTQHVTHFTCLCSIYVVYVVYGSLYFWSEEHSKEIKCYNTEQTKSVQFGEITLRKYTYIWYTAIKHLFNQFDTGQQIHTKINKVPMNTLLGVFLLFQDEHDVVKELLQFLIGEVNTQLLEAVVLHGEYLQVIYVYI